MHKNQAAHLQTHMSTCLYGVLMCFFLPGTRPFGPLPVRCPRSGCPASDGSSGLAVAEGGGEVAVGDGAEEVDGEPSAQIHPRNLRTAHDPGGGS